MSYWKLVAREGMQKSNLSKKEEREREEKGEEERGVGDTERVQVKIRQSLKTNFASQAFIKKAFERT